MFLALHDVVYLGSDAVYVRRKIPTFTRNTLHPTSGLTEIARFNETLVALLTCTHGVKQNINTVMHNAVRISKPYRVECISRPS
jgi:hypothetical protein